MLYKIYKKLNQHNLDHKSYNSNYISVKQQNLPNLPNLPSGLISLLYLFVLHPINSKIATIKLKQYVSKIAELTQ